MAVLMAPKRVIPSALLREMSLERSSADLTAIPKVGLLDLMMVMHLDCSSAD
jgi:hypothetical protein